jgi:hypothetical protein
MRAQAKGFDCRRRLARIARQRRNEQLHTSLDDQVASRASRQKDCGEDTIRIGHIRVQSSSQRALDGTGALADDSPHLCQQAPLRTQWSEPVFSRFVLAIGAQQSECLNAFVDNGLFEGGALGFAQRKRFARASQKRRANGPRVGQVLEPRAHWRCKRHGFQRLDSFAVSSV